MGRHNDDAEAVCFQNGERAIWWRELAKTHLVLDEGGRFFVLLQASGSEGLMGLQHYRDRFTKGDLEVSIPGGASQLSYFRFEIPWGGYQYFWAIGAMWECVSEEGRMTPSKWQESWWPWWRRLAERLGCSEPDLDIHIRRAAPTRKATGPTTDPRSGLKFRVLPPCGVG